MRHFSPLLNHRQPKKFPFVLQKFINNFSVFIMHSILFFFYSVSKKNLNLFNLEIIFQTFPDIKNLLGIKKLIRLQAKLVLQNLIFCWISFHPLNMFPSFCFRYCLHLMKLVADCFGCQRCHHYQYQQQQLQMNQPSLISWHCTIKQLRENRHFCQLTIKIVFTYHCNYCRQQ